MPTLSIETNSLWLAYWSIEPRIPMPAWWALTLFAIAALIVYWFRKSSSLRPWQRMAFTLLLGIGIAGPLWIALNPTWVEEIPPIAGKPKLFVLVDQSMSMDIADVESLPESIRQKVEKEGSDWTRFTAAKAIADQLRSTDRVDVEHWAFDSELRSFGANSQTPHSDTSSPSNENARGHRTDIATSLRDVMRSKADSTGYGMLLISDGAHNASSIENLLRVSTESRAASFPIYTVTLGADVGSRNVSITARNPRMIAYSGLPVSLKARIGHSGMQGETTQVSLLLGDEVLQTRTLRLTDEPNQEIRFIYNKPLLEPLTRFDIVATPIPGEATEQDNRTSVAVQRLDEPIGCLLLEGKPYWDSKFLSSNLGANRIMQLTSIVRVGQSRFLRKRYPRPEVAAPGVPPVSGGANAESNESNGDLIEQTGPAPAEIEATDWLMLEKAESPLESMETLDRFRVVVLGRDAEIYLTDAGMDNLIEWMMKKGGCLLCARGEPATKVSRRFEQLLPIAWNKSNEARMRARMSRYGFDSAVFDSLGEQASDVLAMMPSLATAGSPQPRPGLPQVLLQSVGDPSQKPVPIVTYQPIGGGMSIVVEGAGMWRWAFLPPEHSDKEKVYATVWQSLVQWIVSQQDLLPGQVVSLRTDKAAFMTGEKATASLLVRNPSDFQKEGDQLALTIMLESGDTALPKEFAPVPIREAPDLFRVDFGTLEVGFYTTKVIDTTTEKVLHQGVVEVRDPWFEKLEADARPDVMNRLATTSGGAPLRADQLDNLLDRFEQRILENRPFQVKRSTAWDRPTVLLLILVTWIGSWIVRRRTGAI